MLRNNRPRLFSFTSLTSQIFFVNFLTLVGILMGVIYVKQFRESLIELRQKELTTLAEVIAVTVAEAASDSANISYDRIVANEVLKRLALGAGLRAQIYDQRGRLTGDTRTLVSGMTVVEQESLRPSDPDFSFLELIEDIPRRFGRMDDEAPEIYRETPPIGVSQDISVYGALEGETNSVQRINSQGEMILSVAVPVRRVKLVLGALVLSTEGGDIDEIVQKETFATIQVFCVAFLAIIFASIFLASRIAAPIQTLARAAEEAGVQPGRPLKLDYAVIPDMTHRRDPIGELSGSLRVMTTELYDRLEAIDSFAADVAHELKNPLTSLDQAVQTLEISRTKPEIQKRLVGIIQKDVQRMNRLITDISHSSRLDVEMLREERENFDLNTLLMNVCSSAQSKAEKRLVTVNPALWDVPTIIFGMEARMAQVFNNLIDNALSFSQPGDQITVSTKPQIFNGYPAMKVEVLDQGPGIPAENLESIFNRFYSERPQAEEFGNHSGLGLSICRQIVNAHEGKIWAENRTDRSGARFNVILPL